MGRRHRRLPVLKVRPRPFPETRLTRPIAPDLPPVPSTGDHAQEPPPADGQDAPVSITMPQAYMYEHLLQEHCIALDQSGDRRYDRVTFSSSTAATWAKVLHITYTTILNTLSQDKEQSGKQAKIARVARRPTSAIECHRLQSALALLDDAIRGGIVQRLLQKQLVDELHERYVKSIEKKTNPRLASVCRITVIDDGSIRINREYTGAMNRTGSSTEEVGHDIEYYYDGAFYGPVLLHFAHLCHRQPMT